ncbi:hypothetical protein [Neisseria gonorrhoeae]
MRLIADNRATISILGKNVYYAQETARAHSAYRTQLLPLLKMI